MFGKIIELIFGNQKIRAYKKLRPAIERINQWCESFENLTEEEIRNKTTEFI